MAEAWFKHIKQYSDAKLGELKDFLTNKTIIGE